MLDGYDTVQFQFVSHLSLNDASLEKRNKAEERSMNQISFRTQDPNIRQAQSGIRVKTYS